MSKKAGGLPPANLQLSEETVKELQQYTPKQAAFYFWYAKLGNGVRAALKAYYPEFPIEKPFTKLNEKEASQYTTASVIATENLQKHRNPIALYLEENGMDLKYAMNKLQDGMSATVPSNAAILLTKKGETITAEEQGLIEVPDYTERRAWWDRFATLIGLKFREEGGQLQAQQTNVYIQAQKNADKFIVEEQ